MEERERERGVPCYVEGCHVYHTIRMAVVGEELASVREPGAKFVVKTFL